MKRGRQSSHFSFFPGATLVRPDRCHNLSRAQRITHASRVADRGAAHDDCGGTARRCHKSWADGSGERWLVRGPPLSSGCGPALSVHTVCARLIGRRGYVNSLAVTARARGARRQALTRAGSRPCICFRALPTSSVAATAPPLLVGRSWFAAVWASKLPIPRPGARHRRQDTWRQVEGP